MKTICTALAAAALFAVGTTGASAKGREDVSFKVNTASVNFADPVSVTKFRQDTAREIARVCNPGDRLGADLMPDFRCRREMGASFEPAVAQLMVAARTRN